MRLVRALTFALIAWAILLVLSTFALGGPPGYRYVMLWLAWGAYFPAALAFGGALTNQRGLLLLTIFFVGLGVYPASPAEVARAFAPIGLGILAGAAGRRLLAESGATEPYGE